MRNVMLIIHIIGIAMGLGVSLSFMFLGMAAAKMEAAERLDFTTKALSLSKMGHIGILLLFISGGYLMTPHWSTLGSSPLLLTKLILFLVLAGLIGVISAKAKKVRANPSLEALGKIKTLGQLALLVAIAIVCLAVFHFEA